MYIYLGAETVRNGFWEMKSAREKVIEIQMYWIAVQPTRELDVETISSIHENLVNKRDRGRGISLVSLELEEVTNLSDCILVMPEGEIVVELKPEETSMSEPGLYMSGSKRGNDLLRE